MINCALAQPKKVFGMAHVNPVVFPSNLLKVQGDELWLVGVDSLQKKQGFRLHAEECRGSRLRYRIKFTSLGD